MGNCPTNHSTETLEHHYNQRILKFGPSNTALQWNSEYSQYKRYHILLSKLPKNTRTLCDVGCGCGDLFHFIKLNKLPLDYRGIDISANMIIAAQNAYPTGHFSCLDLSTLAKNNRYDCVVASGLFNLRMENHEKFVKETLLSLLDCCSKQLRFNMLSTKTKRWSKSKAFVYVDPKNIQALLSPYVKHCHIIENYLPNDVTFIVEKYLN